MRPRLGGSRLGRRGGSSGDALASVGRWRAAAVLAAVGAAVAATVPVTAAPRPTRHLLVTVVPEPGQALPSAARIAAVTAALESQGLSVSRGPGLLLEASGPAGATAAARAVGTVASVADTAQEIHWRPRSGVIGNDLLQAYGVPSAPLTPIAAPRIAASTPIIASIQLAGWNAQDLAQYAQTQGAANRPLYLDPTYNPVASGQYTPVTVGINPGDESSGGQAEVALDQETLLAVAPQLRQRAYFASNASIGTGGIASAFNQVLSDVTNGMPIVALTTSWGNCEDGSAAFTAFKNTLEPTLQALNAAGVTVFAASGDAGKYDCAPDTGPGPFPLPDSRYSMQAVDYPCSSPSTVCVGGTSHPNGPAPPAPDTAWENATPNDCGSGGGNGGQCGDYAGSGTGGGASTVFPRPSWQAGVTADNQRLVPDFALDGDPQTGLQVVVDTQNHQIGGTSLAAPTAAAMVSDVVAAHVPSGSTPRGLGDIHAALYTHAADFVDVVEPTSTSAIQQAGPGFDEATGLGTPSWTALFNGLDITPPAVRITSWKRAAAANTVLTATWSASDAAGITAYAVVVRQSDTGKPVLYKPLGAGTTSLRFTGKPGKSYTIMVSAADPSNNVGSATSSVLALPFDDRAAQMSKGWSRKPNKHAYASTVSTSVSAGSTAKLTVRGSVLGVVVDFGRTNGIFQLLIDGRPVKTVDTGGPTRWAVPITVTRKAGKHTVSIRVLGTHRHGSGATVSLDGVIAH